MWQLLMTVMFKHIWDRARKIYKTFKLPKIAFHSTSMYFHIYFQLFSGYIATMFYSRVVKFVIIISWSTQYVESSIAFTCFQITLISIQRLMLFSCDTIMNTFYFCSKIKIDGHFNEVNIEYWDLPILSSILVWPLVTPYWTNQNGSLNQYRKKCKNADEI